MAPGKVRRNRRQQDLPSEHYVQLAAELANHRSERKAHAKSTANEILRTKKRWIKYCKKVKQCPTKLLHKIDPGWIKSFLQSLLDDGRMTRQSSLITRWKFFRLAYRQETEMKLNEDISLEISAYIEGPLSKRYDLSKSAKAKPVLGVEDLFAILHYHWYLDEETYSHERYRVQLPFLMLLIAYTSSRPGTLIESSCYPGSNEGILYRDVRLTLIRNPAQEDGDVIVMEVSCRYMKGERNGKPKTYVMHERDDNPVLCPVLYMLALAFADDAFKVPGLTPANIFELVVPATRNSLELEWKDSILDTPVCRRTENTASGIGISPTRCLPYHIFHDQFQHLGCSAGYKPVLTPYSIRRATGNAVDSVGTSAERNQVMGHSRSQIFERYYLSETVKLDVQSAFLGRPLEKELLQAAGRLGVSRDPRAPKKLTHAQRNSINGDPAILRLRKLRDEKRDEIRRLFRTIKEAEGKTPLHDEYKKLQSDLSSEIMYQKRSRLQEARDDFFGTINAIEIEAQLSDNTTLQVPEAHFKPVTHQFGERNRLAQNLFKEIPVTKSSATRRQMRANLTGDMSRLCALREPQHADQLACLDAYHLDGDDDLGALHCHEPGNFPTICPGTQCLFCLGSKDLSDAARTFSFARPDVLRRHTKQSHFKYMDPNEGGPCPHPTCLQRLDNRTHFMNHAASVHNVFL